MEIVPYFSGVATCLIFRRRGSEALGCCGGEAAVINAGSDSCDEFGAL